MTALRKKLWHVRQIGDKWAVFRGDVQRTKPGSEDPARRWALLQECTEKTPMSALPDHLAGAA